MTPLERRCARLAAAYADPARRAEAATTLAEANEGRRRPRLADALNVLWHGLVTRLGRSQRPSAARAWRDAVSVAAVIGLVQLAATAAVLLAVSVWARLDPWGTGFAVRVDLHRTEPLVPAVVAVAAALGAAVAACRGGVRAVRVLAPVAALGVAGAFWGGAFGVRALPPWSGSAATSLGLAVVVAVLAPGTVTRAARAVPSWWWAVVAGGSLAAASYVVVLAPRPFGYGASAAVLTAYLVQAAFAVVAALPLARRAPAAVGGAAVLALPAVPLAAYLVEYWLLTPTGPVTHMVRVGTVTVAAWLVLAGLARRTRARP